MLKFSYLIFKIPRINSLSVMTFLFYGFSGIVQKIIPQISFFDDLSLILGVVNLMVIIPEIASVARLLCKDQNPCSVFAREAVQLVAPLKVTIFG